jgi:hypothetical protein
MRFPDALTAQYASWDPSGDHEGKWALNSCGSVRTVTSPVSASKTLMRTGSLQFGAVSINDEEAIATAEHDPTVRRPRQRNDPRYAFNRGGRQADR